MGAILREQDKSARRGNPTALRFRRDVGSRGERDSREEFSEEGRGRLLISARAH